VVRFAFALLSLLVSISLAIAGYVVAFPRIPERLILVSSLISDKGLYLVLFGVLGIVLALVTRRLGARNTGAVTGLVALAATVALCFPLVASFQAAGHYGATLSVRDSLIGRNVHVRRADATPSSVQLMVGDNCAIALP